MGQFLQVNGDYNIKTAEGAKIILDTGPALAGGSVRVTGNLIVEGETVSVEATNLDLTDNIITLNSGETREGVTLDYSGIEIDRGYFLDSSQVPRAVLLYSEPTDLVDLEENDPRPTWIIANNSAPGPFNFDESNLKLRRILTNATTDDGDLTLIGTGTGVVKVFGTEEYELHVTHDDDIPNKKYVDDRILSNPTFQIVAPQDGDTKVIIADKDITPNVSTEPGSLEYFNAQTSEILTESAVSFIVDTALIAQVFTDRVEIGNLEFGSGVDQNQITSKYGISGDNIYIKTVGGGRLQTNGAVQLDYLGSPGAYVSGSTILYANTPAGGGSGIWFLNDTGSPTDELISKSKALVFSMLF